MKREPWIDYCRGICSFCVLLAHQTNRSEISYLYNAFFLMLFFFISGYLHKNRNIKESILSLFKSLIIPYICLSLLQLFIYKGNLISILSLDWTFIHTTITRIVSGKSLWFVSCLVCVRIYFIAVKWILDRVNCWNRFSIFLVSTISISYIFVVNAHPANAPSLWYWKTAIYSYGVYTLGYFCKVVNKEIPTNKYIAFFMLSLFCLFSYIIQSYFKVEFHVYQDSFESPVVFIILSLLGIFCVCYFSKSFSESHNWVNYFFFILGQNSLILFAINTKVRLLSESLFSHIPLFQYTGIFSIYCICVIQGFIIISIGLFVNKYIPFLVGKHK